MDMEVMTGQKATEGRTGPSIESFLWWAKNTGYKWVEFDC